MSDPFVNGSVRCLSSEHHLQIIYARTPRLLDLKAHFPAEMEHWIILHQDACCETEKALLLCQVGDVREELISYAFVLVVISHGKCNICGVGGLLYSKLSNPYHFFFSPFLVHSKNHHLLRIVNNYKLLQEIVRKIRPSGKKPSIETIAGKIMEEVFH